MSNKGKYKHVCQFRAQDSHIDNITEIINNVGKTPYTFKLIKTKVYVGSLRPEGYYQVFVSGNISEKLSLKIFDVLTGIGLNVWGGNQTYHRGKYYDLDLVKSV